MRTLFNPAPGAGPIFLLGLAGALAYLGHRRRRQAAAEPEPGPSGPGRGPVPPDPNEIWVPLTDAPPLIVLDVDKQYELPTNPPRGGPLDVASSSEDVAYAWSSYGNVVGVVGREATTTIITIIERGSGPGGSDWKRQALLKFE